METISIQKYSDEYQAQVIQLILDVQQNEFSIPITKEDQPDLSDIPNFYQQESGNFWLALHAGKVVGTIALKDIGKNQAALRKLFVNPAYRGGSYKTAKLLLKELLEWAAEKKVETIYLGTTAKFLAAHRFYEKNGFIQIETTTLPSAFPLMKVDTRFYMYTVAAKE